jgi:hypothetical protein
VKDAAGSTVYAYQIGANNPLAWVAPIIVKAPDDQTLATVTDPRYDPSRVTIVDTSARVSAVSPTTLPPPLELPVNVKAYGPGRIALELSAPAPDGSALVVSENYFPGWSAVVDGKPATTVRADYNLIGVPLTAGAKQVLLTFRDAAYETGKTITWIALVIGVLATALGVVADRRTARA